MEMLVLLDSAWYQQTAALILLGVGMIMFMKNRFRYDVVSLFLMISIVVLGILSYEEAFANFGHPAIVIVAAMFIMSQALVHSGIVDIIVSRITFLHQRPVLSLACLVTFVALISGFVNNIGALAMVMPIALHLAQKSNTPISFYLLPIALASHLGGYLTLIGTPRNILISDFREEAIGTPYAMFDFFYVGGWVALGGIIFLILFAWFFFPRKSEAGPEGTSARKYFTEASIDTDSKVVDLTVSKFHTKVKDQVKIANIFRNQVPLPFTDTTILREEDVLCLHGTEDALSLITDKFKLHLNGLRAYERYVTNADDYISIEVVVPPYAKIAGKSWNEIKLQDRFGTNFIGLFRKRFHPQQLQADIKIIGDDILLLQGRRESVMSTINVFSLLPVANSTIHLGRTTTVTATLAIVISAVAIASLQIAPLSIVFLIAVMFLIGFNLVSLRMAYESIDWPVIVLLAGMITLGDALIASGTAESISRTILSLSDVLSPLALLIVILLTTMFMSDYINTTATAVIMAPIAILIATSINVSIDPFLMVVAIGASSAFQTPIGHESNALVMQKGGYRFSDFVRIGLPLEILIALISVPLILMVWPL